MDGKFLDGLGLTEEQKTAILIRQADDELNQRLKAEGVHSVSAARGVITEEGIDTSDLGTLISSLKEKHGYLFASNEPVFTGPAGADKGTDDIALRRALGII
ncbi:MAG: hypothetical protein IJN39_05700 [Clostridia bacterium]|nr:hypothetical protein [Clostridia bacterium]